MKNSQWEALQIHKNLKNNSLKDVHTSNSHIMFCRTNEFQTKKFTEVSCSSFE